MNAAERQAVIGRIQPWFIEMSTALHLGHWVIRVPIEARPDSPHHAACIERIYGQNVARIFLSDDFLSSEPEEMRETYVHELLHCHFRQFVELRDGMEELLGSAANTLYVQQMKNAEEAAVDAIARVLAPFLPLPPAADGAAGETQLGDGEEMPGCA